MTPAKDLWRPHRALLLYANAGLFCDGYILSGIGLALVTLTPQMHLNGAQIGLMGAITLFAASNSAGRQTRVRCSDRPTPAA
jgi:putative MFS transporter